MYQNTADPARVAYEHALLRRLQEQGMPFDVPTPIAARSGRTVVEVRGSTQLAALFHLIEGFPPNRNDLAQAAAVGEALGELHLALARIDIGPPPSPVTNSGTLELIHAQVPDPLTAPDDLNLSEHLRDRLRTVLRDLLDEVPRLYRDLPAQLIHGDYGPGNTLMHDGRITGVLDFEFAGPDLRAIDVASGWYWIARDSWGAGDAWPTIESCIAGYRARTQPTAAEAEAAPTVARLHGAVAMLHWVGRGRAGIADADLVTEQGTRLLDLDHWLETNATRLMNCLKGT